MEVCFNLRTQRVLAAQDPSFEYPFFNRIFDHFRYGFEMMQNFVGCAALCMPSVVSRKSVTAAAAQQRMKKSFPLRELSQAQIKQASSMAINQHDTERREGSEQVRNRLKLKVPIDAKLGAAKLRGQFILAPEVARGAGENRLRVAAVAARAQQVVRQLHDSIQIGTRGFILLFNFAVAVEALPLQFAQSFASQILGTNSFFFVSLVSRC